MSDVVLEAKPILERFRLDGKVAVVTGGGQGIGRAYAHALGDAGAAVAIADISMKTAGEVVEELKAKNVDAMAIQVDVTNAAQVGAMVDAVVAKWGKLTIGVNNAGVGQWIAAETISEADWDHMMNINLKGVFLCCQAEARVMLPAGYGKIINMASISGYISNTPQNQSHYNTSKAGVIHLTRSLAAEWAPRGVRVNSISAGYTRTQLVDDLLQTPIGKETLPVWMARTPMKRMGEVTDLQGAVLYLAAEVSDFATGSDIIVDGGYCAW
ncbi:MAG: glucose 1-dehydrogenase [Chloroflexi bacterium]|nr:glucose 1-dehydrogenase [Chloroflexota bacterium]